jgi:peptidase E
MPSRPVIAQNTYGLLIIDPTGCHWTALGACHLCVNVLIGNVIYHCSRTCHQGDTQTAKEENIYRYRARACQKHTHYRAQQH